jgi:hypothetical protein
VKTVFLLLAVLALLIVGVAIVGAMLPRTHRASRRAVFRQTPAELYQAARDFAAQPRWNPEAKAVELLPEENGRARFRVTTRHRPITYRVLEDRPGEKLVTEIADENLPFGGRWTWEFSPTANGTALRITEDGEVKNVIFRFLARFAFGYTKTMENYLRDLGRKFDEAVVIEP